MNYAQIEGYPNITILMNLHIETERRNNSHTIKVQDAEESIKGKDFLMQHPMTM